MAAYSPFQIAVRGASLAAPVTGDATLSIPLFEVAAAGTQTLSGTAAVVIPILLVEGVDASGLVGGRLSFIPRPRRITTRDLYLTGV